MLQIMKIYLLILTLLVVGSYGVSYYEYYVPEGEEITSGLVAEGEVFTLNGKDITILSGSFHYFRIHPDYWRDTFKKFRAAGLNAIQTYMPWNLHNPERDVFDFGDGSRDMSAFLDVRTFIQMAQEEDLFVILRPGPYICAEWEFGGLPSWLMTDYTMSVRTAYSNYTDVVDTYLQAVTEQVIDLTFMKGGPIISVQIENEYAAFGYNDRPRDKVYLKFIQDAHIRNGLDDVLFFTSDGLSGLDWGALPGVLMMGNFESDVDGNLDKLEEMQPNRPMMVAEFWTGWFDHWTDDWHNIGDPDDKNWKLDSILQRASVNLYMFIGGTNFGFMAGANYDMYYPDTTSYDYGAPLSESGDYTDKYWLFKDTFQTYNPLDGIVDMPETPVERTKGAYGNFAIQESMRFQSLLDQVPVTYTVNNGPIAMEDFSFLNNGNGQSYGYAVYSASVNLPIGESSLLVRGHVRDMAQVIVNGEVVTWKYNDPVVTNDFGFWDGLDKTLTFRVGSGSADLIIMVENLGRVNYGSPHMFKQKKGLWEGPIYLNDEEISQWNIIPLEFTTSYVNSLEGWENFDATYGTPAAYRVIVTLDNAPEDTFLDMRNWNKGVVFVNGFNLGRYWSLGPCRTLYVPAPLMNTGDNEFVIFEQYEPGDELRFTDYPIFD